MNEWREFDAAILLRGQVEEWSDAETQTTRIVGHPKRTRGVIVDLRPGDLHCEWQADDGQQEPMTVALSDLGSVPGCGH
jgi:hypothetical protein